jgi:hypothetical protein
MISVGGQREIIMGNQGIEFYWFSIDNAPLRLSNFMDEFLHSSMFKNECVSKREKEDANPIFPYLGSAFNDKLAISDFRLLTKEEILEFFSDYSKLDEWGEDKGDFLNLFNNFSNFLSREHCNDYFIISKEWFDSFHAILTASSKIYNYYFLIIWINQIKELRVCVWNYD